MNYLEIIRKGYFNENNREHLKNYFRRECKKAEKEYYSAGEFYSGCLKVIEHYEHQIKKQYYERKKEIYFVLNNVDKGIIDIGKDDPKEVKERWRQELESLNKNHYSVTLPAGGHLLNEDIAYIKNAILEAQNNAEPQPESRKDEKLEVTKLSEIFKDISKYKKVMEILVKNGYCQPNTYIWKDSKKSNKSTIVFLLKIHLHAQGYFKENKRPANREIKIIAKNTFGCNISESHIKQTKNEDIDIQKIIPPASSL